MTTKSQDQWAQLLEDSTQREIRQMAEWAVEHLEDPDEVKILLKQSKEHLWSLLQ